VSYNDMTVSSAILSYLENYAPVKPSDIASGTGKPVKQVYATLYQLKKAGKVKNLKGKGWTVVHRAPKKKAEVKVQPEPEQNTVGQYDESSPSRTVKIAQMLAESMGHSLKLETIVEYLEDRNAVLQEEVRQLRHDIEQYVSRQGE
jgi:hypothetical protein